MYKEYCKERENLETIETEKGFIIYRIDFPICIINDYYVKPEFRKNGHGEFLANQVFEICRQAGVKAVFCQSDEIANNHDISRKAIENFGFKLYTKQGSINHYFLGVLEWEKQ